MKISVVSGAPDARTADVLAYAAFAPRKVAPSKPKSADKKKKKADDAKEPKPTYGGHLADVDEALGGLLLDTAAAEGFTGRGGSVFSMHTHGRVAAGRVALLGMGDPDKVQVDDFRKLAAQALKLGEKTKAKRVVLVLPEAGELRQDARIEAA